MKKIVNSISKIVFALHFLLCASGIGLSVAYRFNYDTNFGKTCADWALGVCSWAFICLIVVIPVLFVSNILSIIFANGKNERIKWIVWTILAPITVSVLAAIAGIVLAATTGGV